MPRANAKGSKKSASAEEQELLRLRKELMEKQAKLKRQLALEKRQGSGVLQAAPAARGDPQARNHGYVAPRAPRFARRNRSRPARRAVRRRAETKNPYAASRFEAFMAFARKRSSRVAPVVAPRKRATPRLTSASFSTLLRDARFPVTQKKPNARAPADGAPEPPSTPPSRRTTASWIWCPARRRWTQTPSRSRWAPARVRTRAAAAAAVSSARTAWVPSRRAHPRRRRTRTGGAPQTLNPSLRFLSSPRTIPWCARR
mmetsp:Transcript_7739/g.32270  ORF Transcript_7739/g.32270 Transcript_7739/m.32270 type:complete len:258 (-) Transcript_7739:1472-2245(-)